MIENDSVNEPIKWVSPDILKSHPKNPNKHPKKQLEILGKILKYQGWRYPLVVDENMIVWAGNGRLEAAKLAGFEKVPIQIQKFESEEQAYAFLVSDNAISDWSRIDLGYVNLELQNLGPDFDIDNLGIKDFQLDANFFQDDSDGNIELVEFYLKVPKDKKKIVQDLLESLDFEKVMEVQHIVGTL